jgi:uncharacterized membrane protein (UPF0127 family)
VAAPHFLSPLLKKDAPAIALVIERAGGPGGHVTLATHVEIALDSASRKRGLLGRTSLAPGHALVIAPSNGVHTFFMKFPIDIVFVARDGTVVKIAPAVKASRIAFAWRGFAVIELAAGAADAVALAMGEKIACAER